MANVFAQAEALAFGKTRREVARRGHAPDGWCRTACSRATGRRTTILAERLTPALLGKLVALYEHSVFTQGAIWGINSFDQWGVELGKVLADADRPRAASAGRARRSTHDSSTNALDRALPRGADPELSAGRAQLRRARGTAAGAVRVGRRRDGGERRVRRGCHRRPGSRLPARYPAPLRVIPIESSKFASPRTSPRGFTGW